MSITIKYSLCNYKKKTILVISNRLYHITFNIQFPFNVFRTTTRIRLVNSQGSDTTSVEPIIQKKIEVEFFSCLLALH